MRLVPFIISLCGVMVALSLEGAAFGATTPRAAAKAAGATTFEATVISVRHETFPESVLALEVTRAGTPSALRGRGDSRRLLTMARAARGKGGVLSFGLPRNVAIAGAWYLLPGDRIKGRMIYGEEGWTLDTLERTPPAAPPAARRATLQVELSADHETYRLGEDVQMSLSVSNTGAAPAVFNFPTGQRYDFAVRQGSREIWRWSKGRAFTQAATALTVGVGETLRFRELWPGLDASGAPVEPGTYTLVGWVTAQGQETLTQSSMEIEVVEGERSGPTIEDLITSPRSYMNKEITLEGTYRAQLAQRGEPLVEGGPPTSRSDWILQDATGSIYVAGTGSVAFNSRADLNARVRVKGLVRMNPEGRLYLRAYEVQRQPARR